MYKKLLSLLLVIAMTLSVAPGVLAAQNVADTEHIHDDARQDLLDDAIDSIDNVFWEREPNNVFSYADFTGNGYLMLGTITREDLDIFYFTTSQLSDVTITGYAPSSDFNFSLLDSQERYLGSGYDERYSNNTYVTKLKYLMGPGKYYIACSDLLDFHYNYEYGVALEVTPHAHDLHSYTLVEATCTTRGYRHCMCYCGYTQDTDFTPALGHNYNVTASTATCTQSGSTTYTCSRCSHSYTEQQPALGHLYENSVVEPTCTSVGFTNNICSRCHHSYTSNWVPALGHNYRESGTTATCTQSGSTTYTCSRCSHSYTDTKPALGHNYRETSTTATCTQSGSSTYTCSRCHDSYTEDKPPLGHYSLYEGIPVLATCTRGGGYEATCMRCGQDYIYGETPPLGHNYQETRTAATCTRNGSVRSVCTRCSDVSNSRIIYATGHVFAGYEDQDCNICGLRKTSQSRPVTHMYRMYNPNTGEHFYTGSDVEKGDLLVAGWQYEGVGFSFPVATGKPVYRLFEPATGEHLYTMDEAEKANLMASGWNYEGVAFNSGFEDEVAQFRLHNPNEVVGAYHFTSSPKERDDLISLGWEYQGIGWYSCWKGTDTP